MTTDRFQTILSSIARSHGVTSQEVYLSMQKAICAAQQSTDPAIQAKWKRIPHKGSFVTVEELLEYIFNLKGPRP